MKIIYIDIYGALYMWFKFKFIVMQINKYLHLQSQSSALGTIYK